MAKPSLFSDAILRIFGAVLQSSGASEKNGDDLAGAPGFEPGITGSKPGALPLGYAPIFGKRYRPQDHDMAGRVPSYQYRARGAMDRDKPHAPETWGASLLRARTGPVIYGASSAMAECSAAW